MKSRPMLFSAPMVRAILAGNKSQTRRVMKNPPAYPGTHSFAFELHPFAPSAMVGTPAEGMKIGPQKKVWVYDDWCKNIVGVYGDCPYGQPGDQLWVRETWAHGDAWYSDTPGLEWKNTHRDGKCTWVDYAATYDETERTFAWTPSIFMPRWASRITLEITDVRVERLAEISEIDAEAEGAHRKIWITSPMSAGAMNARGVKGSFRDGYKDIWEDINGPGSWALSPWVWAISFRKL